MLKKDVSTYFKAREINYVKLKNFDIVLFKMKVIYKRYRNIPKDMEISLNLNNISIVPLLVYLFHMLLGLSNGRVL